MKKYNIQNYIRYKKEIDKLSRKLEKKDWEATHCLMSHLEEGYIHGSLIYNALKARGYPRPKLIFKMGLTGSIRRGVRKYFRKKLGLVH